MIRGAGALLGVSTVAAVLVTARPAASSRIVPPSVSLEANRSATLALEPVGLLVPNTRIVPGVPLRAGLSVSAQGETPTDIRVRVRAAGGDGGPYLEVASEGLGRQLDTGAVAGAWSRKAFRLEPGEQTRVRVAVRLRGGLPAHAELGATQLQLEFQERALPAER